MLRSFAGMSVIFQNNALTSKVVGINAPNTQIVRWRAKKPRWVPLAKSKLFKVDVRPNIPRDELIEMMRLQNSYRTFSRSIKNFFETLTKESQVEQNQEHIDKQERLDFLYCQKINDEWNKEIALKREERLKKEWAEKEKVSLKRLALAKAREQKELAESEKYIRTLKQEAATFITRETLDQAIEAALNNVVTYNEAIDVKGNTYTDIFDKPGVLAKQGMATN